MGQLMGRYIDTSVYECVVWLVRWWPVGCWIRCSFSRSVDTSSVGLDRLMGPFMRRLVRRFVDGWSGWWVFYELFDWSICWLVGRWLSSVALQISINYWRYLHPYSIYDYCEWQFWMIFNEVAVDCLNVLSQPWLEELGTIKNTSVKVAGFPKKIWTQALRNTKQDKNEIWGFHGGKLVFWVATMCGLVGDHIASIFSVSLLCSF